MLNEEYSKILGRIYRPKNDQTISAWAEEFVQLPQRESETAGGYRLATAPYQKFILDFFQREGNHELIVVKSSRAGVTLSAYVAALWAIENEPHNILAVLDEEDACTFESKHRFQPLMQESGVMERIGLDKKFQNRILDFPNMNLFWKSASADGTFDRIEVDWIFLDEMRNYPISTAFPQSRQRLKNKSNSKLFAFSEPSTEASEHWQEWLKSSQDEILLRCPHCDALQSLVFERLMFSHCKDGERYDIDRVLDETYYKCAKNDCEIYEHQRGLMWEGAETRIRNKAHDHQKWGLQITDLHSSFVPWGETAKTWIESLGDLEKMRKFDTAVLAKAPLNTYGEVSDKHVYALCKSYARWEIPFDLEQVAFTCQVVDTQKTTYKTGVVVFDKAGNWALVNWGEFKALDECKEWGQQPIRTMDGETVTVLSGVVDEGDGNRVNEVREWCLENYAEGWMPIRGLARRQVGGNFRESYAQVTGYTEEVMVLQIDERVYKYDLVYNDILKHERNERIGKPVLMLPHMIDEVLLKELQNEYLRKKKVAKGASQKGDEWFKAGPNDYLDVLKYAKALFGYMRPLLVAEGILIEEE